MQRQITLPLIVIAAILLSPAAAPTPTNASSSGLDPTVIAAILGLGGAILAALIAGGFVVYQQRKNAELQRLQDKQAQEIAQLQHKQAQEIAQLQHKQAQEITRLQQELQEQAQTKERERQRKEMNAKDVLDAMQRATTLTERVQAYRDSLRADPRIARLQILDMDRPLEVTNIYVRVRLHQESKILYEDFASLHEDSAKDPNAFFAARQLRLEQRATSALNPEDAISTYKRCVIVGDPGAGKTTLLKYLTLKSVENQLSGLPGLPIHIELNVFVSSAHQDLLDYAAWYWDTRYGFPKVDARAYMDEQLRAGKAWLLLDALDETAIGETLQHADESYKRVTEAIMQQTTRYHQAPIVVTARKAGYRQRVRLSGFTELEVLDFRSEDIEQFIRAWFACRPSPPKYATAADLLARLARNPRIRELAANPLLLSLIVIVYEEQLDLPDRRAELYHRCVETLLAKWDSSRDIRRLREFKPERKQQLLEVIAWHFHLQGKRYFPQHELLTVIADFLPVIGIPADSNARILAEIEVENGLLKEQAQSWHGFLHLTLQEYFTAQYVTDHRQLEALLEHRGDPWWEEVFLLYAGRVPDASPLFHYLLEQESAGTCKEDIFLTNLVLAGRCLATRPIIWQTSLRQAVTERLFQALVQARYALTSTRLADTLAEIGGVEVNARLLRLLADEQVGINVRRSIAEALGRLGERTVAPELVRLLADEQVGINVRRSIAEALGRLGERTVAPELVRLLADEQVGINVRRSIAEALGRLGERTVAPELVRLLADEQVNEHVRWLIAEALGRLGERTVAPESVRLLADKQVEAFVRERIAVALGRLGERTVAPELVRLLADEQVEAFVRASIAVALGRLGERTVAPELVRLLADERVNEDVRASIALALGKLGERTVAPELVRLLADEQVGIAVRRSIALALGDLGERTVAPELVRLLADKQVDRYVRQRIAEALGRLGERTVAPELVRLLADEQMSIAVRRSIVWALGRLGERTVAPELVWLLADEQVNEDVRESIALALGDLGERTVAPELVRLLADKHMNEDVQRSIASALSSFADDEATVHGLAAVLDDSLIKNDVYSALWEVSQRGGLRVLRTAEGKIEVVKMN